MVFPDWLTSVLSASSVAARVSKQMLGKLLFIDLLAHLLTRTNSTMLTAAVRFESAVADFELYRILQIRRPEDGQEKTSSRLQTVATSMYDKPRRSWQ